MKTTIQFLSFAAILAVAASPAAYASEVFNSPLTQGPGVYYANTTYNANWDVVTTGNLQLGLEAINRFVAPITPNGSNYFYSPSAGPLASWDLAFSVNSGSDPLSTYSYSLTITDVTTGQSASFDPTLLPDNGQANGGAVACHGCAYDGSNTGFQNAENPGFSFLQTPGFAFNASAADKYTVELTATGGARPESVTINVLPTPEPSSLVLLGTGLVTALGAARRKFKA